MAKKIMVVDDEESLRELLDAVLTPEGYEVTLASDGKDCLEKLKTLTPDLILLDMMMPGLSGRETCEKIRENPKTKGLKVAFLTVARFSESGKDTLKKMQVSDYITKPFDNADLIKRVKKIIG
ncbi:MAG: response regulator [Nanoarchaeota archaeon]|nr:response regulator [Nanoarchaeota archaeon]MBU4299738.1 response regulator [Nanoarchaeota archaeon]MBU4452552.1 response regulator [Nanoarchaeota archaeon]MCG2723517.1 response regulator [archaeon]